MNNTKPELRADKTGKMVTRHVRIDSGPGSSTKNLPSPSLAAVPQRKKRAFKPTDDQLVSKSYMNPKETFDREEWGNKVNRMTSQELEEIPMPDTGSRRYFSDDFFYRFEANDIEVYDVMSVVRPWDAMNLLARGIRTADGAREFIADHGLEHLDHGQPDIADEMMRARINTNMAASYIDEIIERRADPKAGAEWVKACSLKSIMYKAEAIRDEMLSGEITIADLKSIGIRNLAPGIKPAVQHLIHMRNDNNPNFTVDDIIKVMEYQVFRSSIDTNVYQSTVSPEQRDREIDIRLNHARFCGYNDRLRVGMELGAALWLKDKMRDEGNINDREIAELTDYESKMQVSWYSTDEYYEKLVEVFRAGVPAEKAAAYVESAGVRSEVVEHLDAALKEVPLAVVDGWL